MLIGNSPARTAGGRNRIALYLGVLKLLMLPLFICTGVSIFAQTLEIKLVDGRSGRPMVGASAYVNVWGRNRAQRNDRHSD